MGNPHGKNWRSPMTGLLRWPGRRGSLGRWPLAVVALVLTATGCSTTPDVPIQTRQVFLVPVPGANDNSPIAVDLVFAFVPDLTHRLEQMAAADWFPHRQEVEFDFPTTLKVTSFEVVPGQERLRYDVPDGDTKATAAFIFARYAGTGPHRVRIDGLRSFVLKLNLDGFSIEPLT